MREVVGDAAPGAVVRASVGARVSQWVVPACGVHRGVVRLTALGSARGARAK